MASFTTEQVLALAPDPASAKAGKGLANPAKWVSLGKTDRTAGTAEEAVRYGAHFGDGSLRAADLAGGLVGAVVKDPVQDKVVWQEYLETVVKERDGWKDLYRACRTVS